MAAPLKAPFPYFGGKRKAAALVWERFGALDNYVEPFFGSGAVLLARPDEPTTETVNDADGLLSNFWRAITAAPRSVAAFADWPVSENDLHARHAWLVGQKDSLQSRLEGDPDYFDCKIASWWVWGTSCWIGSGFCSGKGPWQITETDGVRQLVHGGNAGQGVNRQLVHVGNAGQGVKRKLVHVGNAGRGVKRKLVHVGDAGRGVNRKRERLSGFSGGSRPLNENSDLEDYFSDLSSRLKKVRVCCGDWSRVCGPSVTKKHGVTGMFLDPPYADTANRDANLYRVDCDQLAHAVRDYAIREGSDPLMRIALCGYEGEHEMPSNWECVAWNAGAGFSGQRHAGAGGNGKRERIWFSPHCLQSKEPDFFE